MSGDVGGQPCCGLISRLRASFASRLARDTLTVFLFSGLGRALSLGKEMLVAALFGVGGQLDVYVLAFLIPSLLVNIFGAAFASALIPALGRASAKAQPHVPPAPLPDPRRLLALALALQAGLTALAAVGLLCVPAPAMRVLAPFLDPARLEMVKAMQTALLPLFILASLSQTMAACVNYRGGFRGPALASTLGGLAIIAVIAVAHAGLGLGALVAGVDAGAAVEFCLLAWMLRRAWAVAPPVPSPLAGGTSEQTMGQTMGQAIAAKNAPAGPRGPLLRALFRDWALLALGAGTLALSAFIDNVIASTLGEGAVSALSYAWKLPSGFATLLGLTLSTVLLPYFTSLASHAPPGELARSCKRVVTRLLAVCVPLAAAGALASPLLVALLFQRGRFDAQAAGLVGAVQACYFIQLPFYLLCIVTQRMLQALSRFRFLFALQAGLVVVNALTCYALSRVFGVAGIAVSSTCMYALTAGISLLALRRRLAARSSALTAAGAE